MVQARSRKKDIIRLKNFYVPLISNSVETDKKNGTFRWQKLVSQHPQDSKAPVHLAQFKHERPFGTLGSDTSLSVYIQL